MTTVTLPDGRKIRNVPKGTTKTQLAAKLIASTPRDGRAALLESLFPGRTRLEPPTSLPPEVQVSSPSPDPIPISGVGRVVARLPRAITEEAKAGREQFMSTFNPIREGAHGIIGDIASRPARLLFGAGRAAFPVVGGGSTALAKEPVARVTGSELAGEVAGVGLPLGLFGLSKVPVLAERISRAKPITQLTMTELGLDTPEIIPSVTSIGRAETIKGGVAKGAKVDDEVDLSSLADDDFQLGTNMRKRLADLSDTKFGFKIPRGERSGNRQTQILESAVENLPGGSFQPERDFNLTRTNEILSGMVGRKTKELNPEWVAETAAGLSSKFEELASQAGKIKTKAFLNDARTHLPGEIREGARKKMESVFKIIENKYGDSIDAVQYKEIRSELSAIARDNLVKKPDLARRYRAVEESLDNTFEKFAGKDKRKEWKDVRAKYRNWLIIENSIDRGTGLVNVGELTRGIEKSYRSGFKRYKLGENDMVDLATVLKTFKNQIPSSGTAERSEAIDRLRRVVSGGAAVGMGDITGGLATAAVARAYKNRAFTKPKK